MNRSSLIAPSLGSYSYLLRPPLGISTTQRSESGCSRRPAERLIHLVARHREAGLAVRPRRVPRVPGDVLAAQRGVRVLVGDQVAKLLEPVVADPRSVDAVRVDVRRDRGIRCALGHGASIPTGRPGNPWTAAPDTERAGCRPLASEIALPLNYLEHQVLHVVAWRLRHSRPHG